MCFSNPRRTMTTRPGSDYDKQRPVKTATLLKGATFHSLPTYNPFADHEECFPPRFTRSHSHLDDATNTRSRRMALTLSTIDDIDVAFSRTTLSESKSNNNTFGDTAASLPPGIFSMPVVDPAMAKVEKERHILHPHSLHRSRHHESDSGLGTSIASKNDKSFVVEAAESNKTKSQAATRTAIPSNSNFGTPSLGHRAISRIHEHMLRPLLHKSSLQPFEPIVLDVSRRIRSRDIICLRDIEKTLILRAPEKVKTAALYMDFCLTSIRCVQATVEYLTDHEQVRPGDRPYTNGYFVDLKDQIFEYGRQLAIKEKAEISNDMDFDKSDEIRLFGGIAENGRPAELIRVKKDGSAISLATGKPVDLKESRTKFKRSLSQQLEDGEDVMRCTARRRKNATPEALTPKKCREPGCNREFNRPCDLTKHEKTHSRPWKCPISSCKYHNDGWPTEKERDRHVNDKHSDAPAMHECLYKPCMYKSKRESNCKQHMEKKHGFNYVRTKSSVKSIGTKGTKKPAAKKTCPVANLSPPNTTPSLSVSSPRRDAMPVDMAVAFPMYPDESDWLTSVGISPDTMNNLDLAVEEVLSPPSSASSYEQFPPYQNGSTFIINDEDLYAARMQLPTQMSMAEAMYSVMQQPPRPDNMQIEQRSCAESQADVSRHFSPVGQGGVMLFTPGSALDTDEGFDDSLAAGDVDFQLFDASGCKTNDVQPLFDDMPSAITTMGFSQNTQPEIFQHFGSSLDMTDCTSFL